MKKQYPYINSLIRASGFRGNALFLILIAVALFGALSYALTKSMGGGGAKIDREKATLNTGLSEQCIARVERAANMLKVIGKCPDDQVSYELASGANENPDNPSNTACFVFHKDGAGETPCGAWLDSGACTLTALAIGEKCASVDIVYFGSFGGKRLYTTIADHSAAITYDNGTGTWNPIAMSDSDGMANTNELIADTGAGSPYPSAVACRSLGADWYVPSIDELDFLRDAIHTGDLNGTFNESGGGYPWEPSPGGPGWYQSSTTTGGAGQMFAMRFSDGTNAHAWDKNDPFSLRCVRSD